MTDAPEHDNQDESRPDGGLGGIALPLIEHLAELRNRLIYSIIALIVGILICFPFADSMLDFLFKPIAEILQANGQEAQLIFTAPQEKFFVLFRIAMLAGLAVSFPVISFQMWRFVAPGLYKNEKQAFLPFIIGSPALFLMGASFAHFVVTPLAMNFFIGFSDVLPKLTEILANAGGGSPDGASDGTTAPSDKIQTVFLGSVRESLSLTLKFIFAFGLCFQLPVLLSLLGMAGIVDAPMLRKGRKYAIVGILVLAAVATPPDVVTQLILFSVVYALYEVSIFLVILVQKRQRDRREQEEEL